MTTREAILAEIERWQRAWGRTRLAGWVALETSTYFGSMGLQKARRRLRPVLRWSVAWVLWVALMVLLTAGQGVTPGAVAVRAVWVVSGLLVSMVAIRGAWRKQRRREDDPNWRW